MANVRVIANLITGGVCHRFPGTKFVSVESGVGWIPFALEHLDWQWMNCGVPAGAPGVRPAAERVLQAPDVRLLLVRDRHRSGPRSTSSAPDWILYESDFPHPTSMSPGPATAAVEPRQYIAAELGDLARGRAAQDPARQRRGAVPRWNRLGSE